MPNRPYPGLEGNEREQTAADPFRSQLSVEFVNISVGIFATKHSTTLLEGSDDKCVMTSVVALLLIDVIITVPPGREIVLINSTSPFSTMTVTIPILVESIHEDARARPLSF